MEIDSYQDDSYIIFIMILFDHDTSMLSLRWSTPTNALPLGQAISRIIPVSGVCRIHHYLLLSFHRPINVFVEQLLCTWWTVAHIHTHTHWCQRQTVLNDSMNNSSTRSRPLVHWQISSPSLYASWYQALNILSLFQTGHFRLNEVYSILDMLESDAGKLVHFAIIRY